MEQATLTLMQRLQYIQIGGCNCGTKTPDLPYHKELCVYRVASEAYEALALARSALTFAKPMVGALCADSPTADLREKRNKVYEKIVAALALAPQRG